MEQMSALRAQLFAQLTAAIEGAQSLAWQLGTRDATAAQACELYGRLEAARIELDSLRGLARRPDFDIEANWLQKFGWEESLADPAG
jgi:hypothetical protein